MSFDEHTVVARIERLNLRELRFWVRQGWLRPAYSTQGPVFDELDIARIRLLCDLRKELSLSNDVLPVVLNLIDHLHQTRREFRALAKALDEQPEDVRRSVVCRFRDIHGSADTTEEER
ncbi:MerR family transcriptional regulator [Roseovarius sp.]|uniref:MerR family transcriptional regulator n=1 Tax=Roseovarius sp. TaxID=1486281 RepID=UPI003A97511D